MQRSRRVTLSSLLVLMVAMEVEAQTTRDLYTSRDPAGRETVYRVAESRLLATRKWSPEAEPPPLSVPGAVAAAVKRLSTRPASRLRPIKIELIASGGQDWRWFYRIEFYDAATARRAQGPEIREVLVLMDGSIVEPVLAR